MKAKNGHLLVHQLPEFGLGAVGETLELEPIQ
jgi:hypothetical protein